jgi:hypothetical protein
MRYVIRQETFAGTHGNGRDAPQPAVGAREVERVKTTHLRPSLPRRRAKPLRQKADDQIPRDRAVTICA